MTQKYILGITNKFQPKYKSASLRTQNNYMKSENNLI